MGLMLAGLFACGNSSDPELSEQEQLAKDIETIDNYLAEKNITAQEDPSGLRYVITTEGTGPKPTLDNSVVVKYTGKLFDGAIFDRTTPPNSRTFILKQLIKGWQIGFQLMPAGSTGTLYIPSGLGYGKTGNGPVPPNANLIFEVELVDVK